MPRLGTANDYPGERFLKSVEYMPPDDPDDQSSELRFDFGENDYIYVHIEEDDDILVAEDDENAYKIGDVHIDIDVQNHKVVIMSGNVAIYAACQNPAAFESLKRAMQQADENQDAVEEYRNQTPPAPENPLPPAAPAAPAASTGDEDPQGGRKKRRRRTRRNKKKTT
jgi:hypothetical protein